MRRGFSLVEILVVIAVISALSAILLPVLSSVRQKARTSVKVQQLRQLAAATLQYLGDSDGILPPADLPVEIEWPRLVRGGISRQQSADLLNPDMPDDKSVLPGFQHLGYTLNSCLRGTRNRPFYVSGDYNPYLIFQAADLKKRMAVRTWLPSFELPCHDISYSLKDNMVVAKGRFLADSDQGGSVSAHTDGSVTWRSFQFFKDKVCGCSFTGDEPETPFQTHQR